MVGQRLRANVEMGFKVPGAYYQYQGLWFGVTPNGLYANLSKHTVVEHEDGTITVTPSILTLSGAESWHGHLTKGEWIPC